MNKEIITDFPVGERLDKVLAQLYPNYSRSAIEKLIVAGAITVNDQMIKTKYRLKVADQIEVDFSELEKTPHAIDLPVLYEDTNVVVINKPVGILAHSKGVFNKEGTVATWLRAYILNTPNASQTSDATEGFWSSNRAGIVHRLDRATSGIMILAKNEMTQKHLQKQFANRNVKKAYVAIISGELPEKEGLIDVPIERNPKKPATFRAGANGKTAQTAFEVLKTKVTGDNSYTLIELKPYTGRTHQLRVHLAYLKHPIVGDDFYDGLSAARLMLHAQALELTLPGGVQKKWQAPMPKIFNEYL